MQRLKEERNQSDDEIDVRYVIDKIGNGMKYIFDKIGYVVQVFLKRFLLIMLFALIGVGISYLLFNSTKPYYSSSMTLVLAEIRNEFVEDQLDKLSVMIAEDNFEAVADRLDISTEAAREIKQMNFSNLDQDRIEEDSVLTGSPFRIELLLYDNKLFNSMEPALASYLENNRYFSKQKSIRQRQVENLISKYKNEIASIDSIKTSVSAPRGPVNGFVYGEPIDPTNLYRESINMYQQQVALEAELDQLDNIQVVTGFSPRSHPTGPNLMKFLVIGGSVASIIGLLFALRLENKKRISL